MEPIDPDFAKQSVPRASEAQIQFTVDLQNVFIKHKKDVNVIDGALGVVIGHMLLDGKTADEIAHYVLALATYLEEQVEERDQEPHS